MRLDLLAEALGDAGLAGRGPIGPDDLEPLPASGVAHDHVLIAGKGRLVRIPRLSQSGRSAADNLCYQASCFARAEPSGCTPRLYGVLSPEPALPMGALVVDAIAGRTVRLPDDLPAIARCLAAIHGLPVPDRPAPLPVQTDPVAATLAVIEDQADWLDRAGLDPEAVAVIRAEFGAARTAAHWPNAPHAHTLVVADTHPGNYVVDAAGAAWFVDLEKAAYGQPAIDVAHVTLPTSTGWDRRVTGSVSAGDVAAFEAAYLAALPPPVAAGVAPWLGPLRRLTWLRSVTWFARWLARSVREGDPWDAADLPPGLIAHWRAHVRASLAPAALERMVRALPAW
ncbi:MAG: aminoglycoside phosphotransferase [Alphaproteobacteria bacterium]